MYTIFDIDDEANKTAVVFRFNGKVMMVDNGLKQTEISREELDALIAWLRCGLETIDREEWLEKEKRGENATPRCECVHPA